MSYLLDMVMEGGRHAQERELLGEAPRRKRIGKCVKKRGMRRRCGQCQIRIASRGTHRNAFADPGAGEGGKVDGEEFYRCNSCAGELIMSQYLVASKRPSTSRSNPPETGFNWFDFPAPAAPARVGGEEKKIKRHDQKK